MKKILTFIIAFSLVLGFSMNVFASANATENGVVHMNNGDAQIRITGSDGQSLVGKTFYVYKLFDAENAAGLESINYTFNPDFKSVLQAIVGARLNKADASEVTEYQVIDYMQSLKENETSGARGNQEEEGSYSDFRYFMEELRDEIVEQGLQGDVIEVTCTDTSNSITITGLEYGYYIVDEATAVSGTHQAASLCMVSTANPTASIAIKSDYPTVIKKIQEDDNQETIGNEGWNDIGDYEIGQDVPYRFTSEIPNLNGYSSYYWAWHDNMDEALTLQEDTIQIVLSGTVLGTAKHYTFLETEFHLTTDSVNNTFKIEIENIKEIIDREFDNRDADNENVYGQEIMVTYKATLNEKAAEDLGRPGFENDVRIEFSNNPNQGQESQTGFTPWDTVVCYSYQLNAIKINNYGTPLEGAVFRLYQDEACEQEIYVKPTDAGYQIVHSDALDTMGQEENKGMTSNSKGEFKIYGLDSGTYYLKEVSAPTGYRALLDPIKLRITPTFTEERNSYVKGEGTGDDILKLAATANIRTFTMGAYTDKEVVLDVNQEAGSMNLSVVNMVGMKLPITGSQMMLLLAATGVVLMLVSVRKGKKTHE